MDKFILFAADKITIDADKAQIPKIDANSATMDNIFAAIYVVIGALAVFYIIRGALLYVTHGSNPSEVKKARDTIMYSVAALAGSTLVFALIQFIIKGL